MLFRRSESGSTIFFLQAKKGGSEKIFFSPPTVNTVSRYLSPMSVVDFRIEKLGINAGVVRYNLSIKYYFVPHTTRQYIVYY